MDSNMTSLPAEPHLTAPGYPHVGLPGEQAGPHLRPEGSDDAAPSAASTGPAARRARRPIRTLLLGTSALIVLAAGGLFLLSSFDPSDTAQLTAQARQLAANVGIAPVPLVAPAAKLATHPRSDAPPPVREEMPVASSGAQVAEILSLRPGTQVAQAGTPANQGRAGDGRTQGLRQRTPAASSLPPVTGEVGAPSSDASEVAATVNEAPAPAFGRTATLPSKQANIVAPATEVGLPSQSRLTAPEPVAGPLAPQDSAGTVVQSLALVERPVVQPATPRTLVVTIPSDAADVAAALHPAPMSSGEQVEVLHTVAQLAIIVRDLRTQIAALRNSAQAGGEKVDAAVADFERRLALAEARGAINAAMGADPAVQPAPSPSTRQAVVPSSRTSMQGGAQPQPTVIAPAAPVPSAGPHRYRVQAASPGLAILSELDRSGGEGSQLQIGVGDQVPGYGKVTAIQQRGSAWMVQTDHGAIQ